MDITLLRVRQDLSHSVDECFNPCFNGYYTSTVWRKWILYSFRWVSILVLMDITLLQKQEKVSKIIGACFNPCFNGYYTSTVISESDLHSNVLRFNPCFNGYYTSTPSKEQLEREEEKFQSLF